ncbi:phospholipase A2 [Phytoactinopolyspora limicola]|uniref:phospholipase A2 n=1 Tax=Phytoactinopolyspora limicola TaxID=2715536 RepID=UPI00140ABB7A|nr:phospholipase A2 [Phytoactinopolyspora limicola]
MGVRISLMLAAVLVSFILTGAGQVRQTGTGPEDAGAARAVVAATGLGAGHATSGSTPDGERRQDSAVRAVPPDFADVMGYEPDVVTGPDGTPRVVQPHGDCSSPFGPTHYDFEFACKAHDYGYDLLRYATAHGGALGPWARQAIDEQFGSDLRARCEKIGGDVGCRAVAAVSERAVGINSWRQGYGNPGREDPVPYLASAMVILLALVTPLVVERLRQAHRVVAAARRERPVGTTERPVRTMEQPA